MNSSDSPADLAALVAGGGKRRRLRHTLVYGLLPAAAVAGFFAWQQRHEAKEQEPQYVTEPLKRGDVALTVTATGNLQPTKQVSVGSELSGIVQEVHVDRNHKVKKGQPLARLDTTKLMQTNASTKANRLAALAKVGQTEATLRESEASLARLQELHRLSGGKTPSKAEMDSAIATRNRATADLENAKAGVEAAEAAVRSNESDLAKAVIRSPIDGIVLTRSVEPGQTVAASFTAPVLFLLAEDLETMELQVAVAEADIGRVDKGQRATFSVDAWPDRSFNASVTLVAFGSEVVNNVVTYDAELSVPNPDLTLRPGMTATADIAVAESRNVLVVPNAALRFHPNREETAAADQKPEQKKSFVQSLMPGPPRRNIGMVRSPKAKEEAGPKKSHVWVLRDGKPVEIEVKAGLSDGKRTEVSGEGLEENTAVIVRIQIPAAS